MDLAAANQNAQSCHVALLLDEIIIQIFRQLVANVQHRNTWRTYLKSAARTCRAWNEVALDFLWRDVDTVQIARLMEQCKVPQVSDTPPPNSRSFWRPYAIPFNQGWNERKGPFALSPDSQNYP